MIFDIDAQIFLDNTTDISQYVISYIRTQSMCNISHTGEVKLSPNIVQFLDLNEIDLQIYQPFKIVEYGTTVLTGYVNGISKQRNPGMTVSISFSDKYKRAKDYFISDPNFQTNGETLGAMFITLCGMCGLTPIIDSSEAGAVILPPGQTLGLMTVDNAIQTIIGYASAIIYTDGSGDVHLRKGPRAANSVKFSTGPTIPDNPTVPTDIIDGNVFSGTYIESDENARDTISVWGYAPQNPFSSVQQDLRIVATRYVDLGLPVPKTSVYSSSLIQTAAEAERLASEMVQELGKLEEIITVSCQGNPNIEILRNAPIDIDLETMQVVSTKKITTVVSKVSVDGYLMTVTFDEFCPKFAGWSFVSLPKIFYAGTTKLGVYKSIDGGVTWFEYNTGLPTGNKYVKSIAATEGDEVMAIVNSQLWYTTSSGLVDMNPTWQRRYLSVPNNSAGDSPAPTNAGTPIIVASDGTLSSFQVLTTKNITSTPITMSGMTFVPQNSRSWLYETTNAGQSWVNTQLYFIPPSGVSSYNAAAQHLSNRYGSSYVTVGGRGADYPGMWIGKFPIDRTCYFTDYQVNPGKRELVNLPNFGFDFGFHDWDLLRNSVTGSPVYTMYGSVGNRVLQFWIIMYSLSGWNMLMNNYTTDTDPQVTYNTQTVDKLYLRVGIGDYIIGGYDTVPAYLCDPLNMTGITVSRVGITPWSVAYSVTVQESYYGPYFYMHLAHQMQYQIAFGTDPVVMWMAYSGEDSIAGFDEDYYPWLYWPLNWPQRQDDLYPLHGNLGFLKFNLDEIGT